MRKKLLITLAGLLPALCFGQSVIDFQPDLGIRVQGGTTRKAVFHNDTLFLYYGYNLWDGTSMTPVSGLAISTDAPDYNSFTEVNMDDYPRYNMLLLPDGITRRLYGQPMGQNYLISQSSTDWHSISTDPGIRYYLDASDSATFGVSTALVDQNDDVHIYYMGAMPPGGANNIRHCESTDGGDNFTFMSNDICGDLSGPGGNMSHVDPDAVMMSDGTIRLMTMNANGTNTPNSASQSANFTIHSFLSSDNGDSFVQEATSGGSDIMVHTSDFADTSVHSLHDPKIVELPDGRVKVFMNGSVFTQADSLEWNIFSITSEAPLSTVALESIKVTLFPNPSNGILRISSSEALAEVVLLNCSGKEVMRSTESMVETTSLPAGVYLAYIRLWDGRIIAKRFTRI